MRHRARAGTIGRSPSHRKAMYRNLVTSLLEHERVRTTDAKAKGVRSLAEKMITLGKRGDLHARRRALRVIRRRDVAAKVFDDLAERFRDRPGGYTRILKLGVRPGDAAPMAIIELLKEDETAALKPKTTQKARTTPSAEPAAEAKKAAKKKASKKTVKKKAVDEKKAAEKAPKKASSKKKTAKKKAVAKKTAKKAAAKKTSKKKPAAKKKAD